MTTLIKLLETLISFPSITPRDAGCQEFLISYLEHLGFSCQRFDKPPVANFFARLGNQAPLLVFAGHTDVVSVGDETLWNSNPFELKVQDGIAYGRGVADMKGSIAAMMLMASDFIKQAPHFQGSLGFLITSGEEGDDYDKGTPHVMTELQQQGVNIDYCVVGEPSSQEKLGDMIKIGRRGSLSCKVHLYGKQGHVAYPHLAENPIHSISPALSALANTVWDEGNQFFPPTSLQVTYIEAGQEQAGNVIPASIKLNFNIRYSTEQTAAGLIAGVQDIFDQLNLKPSLSWRHSGEPFLTSKGRLLDSTVDTIQALTKQSPILSTSGGTSDARFIAPYGTEVVELGPVNASIHQVNECVSLAELEGLRDLYFGICERIFAR